MRLHRTAIVAVFLLGPGTSQQWYEPMPAARIAASAVFDLTRGTTILFGGGPTDTWEFDGSNWSPIPSGLQPAYDSQLIYEVSGSRTLAFENGMERARQLGANGWSALAITGPRRPRAALAHDLARAAPGGAVVSNAGIAVVN